MGNDDIEELEELHKYIPFYNSLINQIFRYKKSLTNIYKLDASLKSREEIIYEIIKDNTSVIQEIEDNKKLIEDFENKYIYNIPELLLNNIPKMQEEHYKKSILCFLIISILNLNFEKNIDDSYYLLRVSPNQIFECATILTLYFKK